MKSMKAWHQWRQGGAVPIGNRPPPRTGLHGAILMACVSWLAAAPAAASTFNIAPIRANLDTSHHTEALTLANAEDEPVIVQVKVMRWSQAGGEDRLEETRDILATPPVLQLAPKAEQIVRVALRKSPDAVRELSYRVVFQEVPQAPSKDFQGLRVALRLSVPVFIAPAAGKPKADLSWESRWLDDGRLELSATNHGSAHLQITDFDVAIGPDADLLKGQTARYVLPGSRMSWVLTPDAPVPHQGPIKVHGHTDQGEFSAQVVDSL